MSSDVSVKICGLRDLSALSGAVEAGARYVGFNFFPRSPRFVSFDQAATLAVATPVGVGKVGLVVDADDATLDQLVASVPLDFLQLHGHESPTRVENVRARYGLPVIKAVGVADQGDLALLEAHETVADQILVDAKPPKEAVLPGGNGLTFDWRLIAGRRWVGPWMLAGGLTPENVAEAIARTGAQQVDVASGVESAPGVKDPDMMRAFVSTACA